MEQRAYLANQPILSASSFGQRLVILRKACGKSQRALGKNIGVSQVTICNWESGRKRPRPEKLAVLADALNVSVSALTQGAGDITDSSHLLDATSFGERLSTLRKLRRLSLVDLGARIGVSHVAVWKWENGSSYPSPQRIKSIADQLHVSVSFLKRGKDTNIPN